jgi:hypothetical protein
VKTPHASSSLNRSTIDWDRIVEPPPPSLNPAAALADLHRRPRLCTAGVMHPCFSFPSHDPHSVANQKAKHAASHHLPPTCPCRGAPDGSRWHSGWWVVAPGTVALICSLGSVSRQSMQCVRFLPTKVSCCWMFSSVHPPFLAN